MKSVIILCRPNYVDSFSLNPTQTHLILLYAQQKWLDEIPWAILQMDCSCLEESLWLSSGTGDSENWALKWWHESWRCPSSVLELLWKISVCEHILLHSVKIPEAPVKTRCVARYLCLMCDRNYTEMILSWLLSSHLQASLHLKARAVVILSQPP